MRAVCLVLACVAAAQEIDTVILKSDHPRASILDEIEDRAERAAFVRLSGLRDAKQRLRLASEFLQKYPASWLVSRALEIRAKAAIDLDRFEEALADGRESLRFFPENALLLVPLAEVAIHTGKTAEARQHASRAIECLDRFARPASIAERDWPRTERELRAAAHTVLGRANLAERKTAAAARNFENALAANGADVQAALLLGIAYLEIGKRDRAIAWLGLAARSDSALAARAREQLRAAGEARDAAAIPAPEPIRRADAPLNRGKAAAYAGSAACQPCHAAQFDRWKKTGMAKMFRPYEESAVAGDFADREFPGAGGQPQARMTRREGRPLFEIRGPAGWARYGVDYLIGSKWQQAYVTRGAGGSLHVLPVQFNFERRQWINYWETIDPVHSLRADIGKFRAEGAATSYTRNCAPCHTSQLKAAGEADEALTKASFREPGINCEMCHGASAAHVRDPVANRGVSTRSVAVCAQCHMQSALREMGSEGEINYASEFPPSLRSRPFDQFLRRAFYKDGRFRETTFIVESLMRSRCFREGGADCSSCHHPHPEDAAENPVSLKHRDRPDERCLQCHSKLRADPAKHTRHEASSAGSRCEACHMPRIMNALLFKAGTHTIDDAPRADTVRRFGAAESPNACLVCHTDKDPAWLESQLSHWR